MLNKEHVGSKKKVNKCTNSKETQTNWTKWVKNNNKENISIVYYNVISVGSNNESGKTSPGEGTVGIAEAWWDDFHKQSL